MAVTKRGSPSRFESLIDKPHVFFEKFLKDRFPLITDHHLASGNAPDTQSKRKDINLQFQQMQAAWLHQSVVAAFICDSPLPFSGSNTHRQDANCMIFL